MRYAYQGYDFYKLTYLTMHYSSFEDTIIFGTLAEVQKHLDQGAEIDAIDVYGFTPLIETAINGKSDIAALFLQKGASVDLTDATGRTALHWAADNNNVALCQLLLDNGANPNAYTYAGQPVLVMPYLRQQEKLKRLLYQHGANLDFAQDFVNTKLKLNDLCRYRISTTNLLHNDANNIRPPGFSQECYGGPLQDPIWRCCSKSKRLTFITIQIGPSHTSIICH